MYDVDQLRADEFPISENAIYFNHASTAPLPRRTQQKITWSIQRLAEDPSRHFIHEAGPLRADFNERLAEYLGAATPSEIVAMFNTATCANAIASALILERGDNLIFCNVEFPSNAYPWMVLERDGVESRVIEADNGGLTLAALEKAVDDRTRFVAVSAIQFFTGHRTDLEAIGSFCRERGIIFYVDATQAIGHMPINVERMKIDILGTGGQKSLMCPPGVGFMYVRLEVAAEIVPRNVSAVSYEDWLHWTNYSMTPLPGAERFSPGTENIPGMWGVLESIGLFTELTLEAIDAHTCQLTDFAIEEISKLGYRVITPRDAHGPIVTFASGMSMDETNALIAYLAERNVSVVRHLSADGEPHVRLSFHCYNKSR